jgi:hypothetical protein
VGREDEPRVLAHVWRESIARLQDVVRVGANEQRVIEPASNVRHVDVDAVASQLSARRSRRSRDTAGSSSSCGWAAAMNPIARRAPSA